MVNFLWLLMIKEAICAWDVHMKEIEVKQASPEQEVIYLQERCLELRIELNKCREERNKYQNLVEALKRNNEQNFKYFDEVQKRFKQMENWVINQHALRIPESINLCFICAEKIK